MRVLRSGFLSIDAHKVGVKPSGEFPRVFAVFLDFWEAGQPRFLVCDATGFAGYCTPSDYDILGGPDHHSGRVAAQGLVEVADGAFEEARPAEGFAEPASTHARLHLLCFDGYRALDVPMEDLKRDGSRWSGFWQRGRQVLRELELLLARSGPEQRIP